MLPLQYQKYVGEVKSFACRDILLVIPIVHCPFGIIGYLFIESQLFPPWCASSFLTCVFLYVTLSVCSCDNSARSLQTVQAYQDRRKHRAHRVAGRRRRGNRNTLPRAVRIAKQTPPSPVLGKALLQTPLPTQYLYPHPPVFLASVKCQMRAVSRQYFRVTLCALVHNYTFSWGSEFYPGLIPETKCIVFWTHIVCILIPGNLFHTFISHK